MMRPLRFRIVTVAPLAALLEERDPLRGIGNRPRPATTGRIDNTVTVS